MKIWVDGQCFQTPSRRRGIGRYVIELIKGMRKVEPELDLSVSFNGAMHQEALFGKRLLNGVIDVDQFHVWYGATLTGEAITGETRMRQLSEVAIRLHVQSLTPDIAISASPFEGMTDAAVPFLPKATDHTRSVAIFYDAIPLRMPETYLPTHGIRKAYTRRLEAHRHFDGLLAISDYSTREARELVPGVSAQNIMAAVHADVFDLERKGRKTANIEGLDPQLPALLYVGGLDSRKNLKGLIRGVAQLGSAHRENVQLVIVGDMPPASYGELASEWSSSGLDGNKLFLVGFADDADLISYYKAVDLVVQPSILEGFGLTVLEAMTYGTPVIAANTGALPEVVCDPALLFNPHDPHDIARAIGDALRRDVDETAHLVEKARRHAEKFSWETTARTALDFCRTIPKHPARNTKNRNATEDCIFREAMDTGVPTISITKVLAASLVPHKPDRPRVFIDVTATSIVDHKTGIQRVVKHISLALQEKGISPNDREIAFIYWAGAEGFRQVFPNQAFSNAPLEFIGEETVKFSSHDLVLMLDSTWEAHADIFGCLQAARLRGARVISVLYDLVPVKYGCFCDAGMPPVFSAWLRDALQYSDGIACISEAVAIELKAMLEGVAYPLPIDIGFWPLGADFNAAAANTQVRPTAKKAKAPPSFLTVGTVEPRKGHSVILSAFDLLWARGSEVVLHIVGKPGWDSDDIQSRVRAHPEHTTRLIWHSGISDSELSDLYQSCDALIAASFAEGFGLPIVEAAQFGKPIIASDIPVFREVSSSAVQADFFKVGNPEDLMAKLEAFLRRPAPTQSGHIEQYWPSWETSALALLDLIEGDAWQHHYEPRVYEPISTDADVWVMKSAISPATSDTLALSLIEGPTRCAAGRDILVCVDNRSCHFWSSIGNSAGCYGINVWYRPLNADGSVLIEDFPRVRFPLIVWPGDSCGLKLTIPEKWLDLGARQIEVGLVQESIAYWEPVLTICLSGSTEPESTAQLGLKQAVSMV